MVPLRGRAASVAGEAAGVESADEQSGEEAPARAQASENEQERQAAPACTTAPPPSPPFARPRPRGTSAHDTIARVAQEVGERRIRGHVIYFSNAIHPIVYRGANHVHLPPYIFLTRWPAPSPMANANARYYRSSSSFSDHIFFYANLIQRQRILANTSVRLLQGTTFHDSFALQGKTLDPPEEPEDCVR